MIRVEFEPVLHVRQLFTPLGLAQHLHSELLATDGLVEVARSRVSSSQSIDAISIRPMAQLAALVSQRDRPVGIANPSIGCGGQQPRQVVQGTGITAVGAHRLVQSPPGVFISPRIDTGLGFAAVKLGQQVLGDVASPRQLYADVNLLQGVILPLQQYQYGRL